MKSSDERPSSVDKGFQRPVPTAEPPSPPDPHQPTVIVVDHHYHHHHHHHERPLSWLLLGAVLLVASLFIVAVCKYLYGNEVIQFVFCLAGASLRSPPMSLVVPDLLQQPAFVMPALHGRTSQSQLHSAVVLTSPVLHTLLGARPRPSPVPLPSPQPALDSTRQRADGELSAAAGPFLAWEAAYPKQVSDRLEADPTLLALRSLVPGRLEALCSSVLQPQSSRSWRTSNACKSAWSHWEAWCALFDTNPWRVQLDREFLPIERLRESVLQAGFIPFCHLRQSARPR